MNGNTLSLISSEIERDGVEGAVVGGWAAQHSSL
jgi:hypothetical protein